MPLASHARGRCHFVPLLGIGIDDCGEMPYHLTWMDTQLSRFAAFTDHGYLRPPDPCRPSPTPQ
jgi:hypothetical protein